MGKSAKIHLLELRNEAINTVFDRGIEHLVHNENEAPPQKSNKYE